MSVNVGDSYACPDPECGCEIEVRVASRSSVLNIETRTSEVPATDTSLRSRGGPSLAAPDNFGSQGATGEGVFAAKKCVNAGRVRAAHPQLWPNTSSRHQPQRHRKRTGPRQQFGRIRNRKRKIDRQTARIQIARRWLKLNPRQGEDGDRLSSPCPFLVLAFLY